MNQKMNELQNGVKKYLKDLGLDMSKYKGCAKTDTRFIAIIDDTVIHISHDLTRHRAIRSSTCPNSTMQFLKGGSNE